MTKPIKPSFAAKTPPKTLPIPKNSLAGLEMLKKVNDRPDALAGPDVVRPDYLTELEREGLQLIGVDPSKPVSKEVLEKLSATIQQMREQTPPMPTTAIDIPPAVDIESLPPAEQAKHKQSINSLLKKFDELQQQVSRRPGMGAPAAAAAGPVFTPPPKNDIPVDPLPTEPIRRNETSGSTPESNPAPPPASDAGGGGAAAVICPRCGFDCRNPDPVEVSDQDKVDFLSCILASPAVAFSRTYPLFGGHLSVTFRELRVSESMDVFRAVQRQAAADGRDGLGILQSQYLKQAQYYRSVVALTQIVSPTSSIDLTTAYQDAKANGFTVEKFADLVTDEYLATDSWVVVVQEAYSHFHMLCDKLRSLSQTPDFWPAIG